MSEKYEPPLEGIDIAKLESLGWQITLCPVCGMSAAAFKPYQPIAALQSQLAESRKECEGLREALQAMVDYYGTASAQVEALFAARAALSAGEKE